jgi:hypothetical protein
MSFFLSLLRRESKKPAKYHLLPPKMDSFLENDILCYKLA